MAPRRSAAQTRNGKTVDLPATVRDWATPSARDWRDGRASEATHLRNSRPLNEQILRERWPTSTAGDTNRSGAAGYSTTVSGRHLGTTLTDATVGPRGRERSSTNGSRRESLDWPTPNAADGDRASDTHVRGNSTLNGAANGKLNPRWVAQLMGLPADWLEVQDADGESS
jgi:hypothetical protein